MAKFTLPINSIVKKGKTFNECFSKNQPNFFQSLLSIHLPAAPSTRESRALIHVYYVSQVVHTIFSVEIIFKF